MRSATILIVFGIVLFVGGVLAVANPFAASLAVNTLVGVFLLVSGAVQLWVAFADPGLPHRIWTAIAALIALVAGVSLLANPLQGLISLTVLVGILLLVGGIVRIAMAFNQRDQMVYWALLLSGAASAVIGILVFANILAAATTLLGLLLGIQLLADGIALLALGLIARGLFKP
jgi:uncharacterized membrane protein HdeD (DUF308 family)